MYFCCPEHPLITVFCLWSTLVTCLYYYIARSQIWRVEEHDLYPLEPNLHGVFFSGDSYVIKYSFMANWKRQIIIYFWQVAI